MMSSSSSVPRRASGGERSSARMSCGGGEAARDGEERIGRGREMLWTAGRLPSSYLQRLERDGRPPRRVAHLAPHQLASSDARRGHRLSRSEEGRPESGREEPSRGGGRGAASQQHAFALPVVWRRGKATNARRRLGGVGTERADDGTIGIRRRAYIRWPAYSSVADGCSSVSPTNGGGLAFRRQTYRDPMEFLAEEALARLDSAALSSFT